MTVNESPDQSSIFAYLAREVQVDEEPSSRYQAYLASALTTLNDDEYERLKTIRDQAERACDAHDMTLYAPMDETHPEKHGDLAPSEVFERDRYAVATSDLLILVANSASFGAGQELEIARHAHVPILALVPKGQDLSRMVYGAPTFKKVIEYEAIDDIAPALERQIAKLYPLFDETRKARALAAREMVGDRVRRNRSERGLSQQELADRVGVAKEEIRRIEQEPVEVSNPSLITLCRIAHVLDLSPSTLMNPATEAGYGKLLMEQAGGIEERLVGARNRKTIPAKDRQILERRIEEAFHRMATE